MGPTAERWRWRTVVWLGLGLALIATLPSLGIGLVFDDHGHRLFLQRHLALGGRDFLDMFDICGRPGPADIAARVRNGQLPWWTLPDLSMAFFRPLAVLTHYVDYFLWPMSPWIMHAQNIALYVALVAAVAALYGRMLGRSAVAKLALLFYAVDEAHADGTAWIAGRNTLLTALFVVLTLVAYDRRRSTPTPTPTRSRRGALLAPFLLLCACASGEGAIAAWAYLGPYALLIDRDRWRARVSALLPLALVTVSWQLLYRSWGYGVHGSGFYRDPFDAPWIFLTQRIPEAWPILLREQLAMPTIALAHVEALRQPIVMQLGVLVGVASLAAFLVLARGRRELWFWVLALAASLLPPSAAGSNPRLLFIPGVAAFVLVAELVVWLFALASRTPSRALRYGAFALACVWCVVHGPLAFAFAPVAAQDLGRVEQKVRESARMLPRGPDSRGARVFVLDTPTYFGTVLGPLYRDVNDPAIELHVLCASGRRVKLTRLDTNTFALEPAGGFLREATSWLVRGPEHPFVVGQRIATVRFNATVERITPDGRPARVRFQIARLLTANNLLIRWHEPRYERVPLPAIGQSVWLEP